MRTTIVQKRWICVYG